MIFEAEDRVNIVLQNGNIVEAWVKLNRNGHYETDFYPNGTQEDYIEFDDEDVDIIKATNFDDEEINPKDIKEVLDTENLEYNPIDEEEDDDAYDRMYEEYMIKHRAV